MSRFVYSGVAAGLIGGAILLTGGTAPASAVPVASPAIAVPAEAGLVEQVNRHRHNRHYDRHRHGHRYNYRRYGFDHYYGGYYYASPWWIGPGIGFGVGVPYAVPGCCYGPYRR